jgi:hypothetical protein
VWPHNLSIRRAFWISFAVSLFELSFLIAAAYVDRTLWLPGAGVGLLEHPGIASILVGDMVLFVVCTKCIQLTSKIGVRLPSKNQNLVRRYFRSMVLKDIFSRNRYFFRIFAAISLIGFLSVANQSVKLLDPVRYYGHDTFDSVWHPYSFAANRLNLLISWCVVVPLFFSYLIIHIVLVNRTIRKVAQHGLAAFHIGHPDKSGGYAFFGSSNTLYMFGLLIVLLEIVLLAYTHSKIDMSNMLPLFLVGIAFVLVSFYSVREVRKVIKQIEMQMKTRGYLALAKNKQSIDLALFAIVYEINFSAYNYIAAKFLFLLRFISFVPAIYKAWQFSRQFPY